MDATLTFRYTETEIDIKESVKHSKKLCKHFLNLPETLQLELFRQAITASPNGIGISKLADKSLKKAIECLRETWSASAIAAAVAVGRRTKGGGNDNGLDGEAGRANVAEKINGFGVSQD